MQCFGIGVICVFLFALLWFVHVCMNAFIHLQADMTNTAQATCSGSGSRGRSSRTSEAFSVFECLGPPKSRAGLHQNDALESS